MQLKDVVTNARAKARNWGWAESSEKETPYLWIEFLFLDLEGDNGEEVTITHNMYVTDNTIAYVLRDLKTMGWNGKNLFELDKSEKHSFDLGVKEVNLTTESQEYNGKPYIRVKFINDPDYKPGGTAIDKEALKKLNDRLKGKIAAYREKGDIPL